VRRALAAICRISRQPWGLVNCRWPDDEFLHEVPEECWHDQANTPWTGVELAFASFLIYRGMLRQGLGVVKNVDARYRKSGMYWDHMEFGGHYYRPMSAWAIVNAMAGLTIKEGHYSFAPKVGDGNARLFFSFAGGWAHYERKLGKASEKHSIAVRSGTLRLKSVAFDLSNADASRVAVSVAGKRLAKADFSASCEGGRVVVTFRRQPTVGAGSTLSVRAS
jgi:hypothetical protein